MTCQNREGCRIRKGERHLPTCPRYGATSGPSGPSGLTKENRVNVSRTVVDELRVALSLANDATPNQVLRAAAAFVRCPRT